MMEYSRQIRQQLLDTPQIRLQQKAPLALLHIWIRCDLVGLIRATNLKPLAE
jgi:hypothetical protein